MGVKYKYSARTKDGELQVGFVEAPTKEIATNTLSSHNLFVLSIEGGDEKIYPTKFSGF